MIFYNNILIKKGIARSLFYNNILIKKGIARSLFYNNILIKKGIARSLLIDLFNREVIGYSAGSNKTANLVQQAFYSTTRPLKQITLFHTDCGNEFKNKIIDEILSTFNIQRSLSNKGCPYDNAVAETTYKTFKTEFINGQKFKNLTQLKYKLFDFVNWYNNIRIHGSLNYLTPV
ncbi:MAG: hypothetical protein CXB60_08725 [Spiroplasma poulsonii]|nr:hypothetical protein [Spiroplasma poulsonii]